MEKYMFYTLLSEKDKQLPIYLISTGIFPNQEEVVRPTGMPFHQIFLVAAGRGTYTCAEKTFPLSPGTFFYVPKNVTHEYRGADETFTTRWVAFDGENIEKVLETLALCEGCAFSGGLQSPFDYAQQQLLEQTKQNTDNAVLSAHAYSALIAFAQLCNQERSGASASLERARVFMSAHYADPLTLDEIAEQARMSKYNFCRVFKKSYGVSPFEYLLQQRIRNAKLLLASRRDLSVAQISASLGFSDTGYFIKCFKKLEHITPLEFRKTRI